MIASYILSQKYYPINYNLRKFALYFGLSIALFVITYIINLDPGVFTISKFVIHNMMILLYVFVVWFIERSTIKTNL